MENQVLEVWEHNDQIIELSLVTEEDIPEVLEIVQAVFKKTRNGVFRLESDARLKSYMTEQGFALKAMRYGEIVEVLIVRTEGVADILSGTGVELSEEEKSHAALFYSWYPMIAARGGQGVPLQLPIKLMRVAEKVMWNRGIRYSVGIIPTGGVRATNLFERGRYKERGRFPAGQDDTQTLFLKDLKKAEHSYLGEGDDYFSVDQIEESDVPAALDFMQEIYENIPDKSWFSMDSRENLTCYMTASGFALQAQSWGADGQSELAAVFVARTSELGEENLGTYLNLNENDLGRVAHMEIAMVGEKFRGKGLQKGLMEAAEKHLTFLGYHWLMGTAHPENVYSVNNFKKLGYEIVAEDIKYGGFPRYIFCKELK